MARDVFNPDIGGNVGMDTVVMPGKYFADQSAGQRNTALDAVNLAGGLLDLGLKGVAIAQESEAEDLSSKILSNSVEDVTTALDDTEIKNTTREIGKLESMYKQGKLRSREDVDTRAIAMLESASPKVRAKTLDKLRKSGFDPYANIAEQRKMFELARQKTEISVIEADRTTGIKLGYTGDKAVEQGRLHREREAERSMKEAAALQYLGMSQGKGGTGEGGSSTQGVSVQQRAAIESNMRSYLKDLELNSNHKVLSSALAKLDSQIDMFKSSKITQGEVAQSIDTFLDVLIDEENAKWSEFATKLEQNNMPVTSNMRKIYGDEFKRTIMDNLGVKVGMSADQLTNLQERNKYISELLVNSPRGQAIKTIETLSKIQPAALAQMNLSVQEDFRKGIGDSVNIVLNTVGTFDKGGSLPISEDTKAGHQAAMTDVVSSLTTSTYDSKRSVGHNSFSKTASDNNLQIRLYGGSAKARNDLLKLANNEKLGDNLNKLEEESRASGIKVEHTSTRDFLQKTFQENINNISSRLNSNKGRWGNDGVIGYQTNQLETFDLQFSDKGELFFTRKSSEIAPNVNQELRMMTSDFNAMIRGLRSSGMTEAEIKLTTQDFANKISVKTPWSTEDTDVKDAKRVLEGISVEELPAPTLTSRGFTPEMTKFMEEVQKQMEMESLDFTDALKAVGIPVRSIGKGTGSQEDNMIFGEKLNTDELSQFWGDVYQTTNDPSKIKKFKSDIDNGNFEKKNIDEVKNVLNEVVDTAFKGDKGTNPNKVKEVLFNIAVHESNLKNIPQKGGPARGYWQVEPATAKSVLSTSGLIGKKAKTLLEREGFNLSPSSSDIEWQDALMNPVVNAIFAIGWTLQGADAKGRLDFLKK